MTLFRRGQASHDLCAKLCDLTEAAANVYTLRQDLFKALVDARNKQLKKLAANGAASGAALWSLGGAIAMGIEITETAAVATATGASAVTTCATAAAAAAACWPVAVAAGSIMLVTGTSAFFHYKEAKALGKRKICYEKSECSILPTSSSILLWDTAFIGLLIGNPLV